MSLTSEPRDDVGERRQARRKNERHYLIYRVTIPCVPKNRYGTEGGPHIEVGMGSGVFTSHRSAQVVPLSFLSQYRLKVGKEGLPWRICAFDRSSTNLDEAQNFVWVVCEPIQPLFEQVEEKSSPDHDDEGNSKIYISQVRKDWPPLSPLPRPTDIARAGLIGKLKQGRESHRELGHQSI